MARTALAALAAVAGTGFASGRAVALFYTQTGRAAWLGIAVSCGVFALLTGLMCRWGGRFGADGFSGLCRRALRPWAARAALGLRGLLLAVTAVLMLYRAGALGALTLPFQNGRLCGLLLALGLALALNLSRRRLLPWAGLLALILGVAFYAALALDPRPVRVHLSGEVQPTLWDSASAAALLGLVHGAMNGCLAAGAALRCGCARPARLGLTAAGMLGAVLCCANAAVARGGQALLAQAMPTVLLSARWGLAGFWLCAAFDFLCAVSTLGAMIGEIGRRV